LCCHVLALHIEALIERQIRVAMVKSNTKTIPLYPEYRDCAAPSAARVLEIFGGIRRHSLIQRGRVIQVFASAERGVPREPRRVARVGPGVAGRGAARRMGRHQAGGGDAPPPQPGRQRRP
ncbi:MAG: hypothetical protein ACRD0U_00165, partial [Acidimicrobiales bacterium]